MIRIECEQGTPIWHETRYRKIGGTTNKDLFIESDTLLIKLVGKHLEDFEDVDSFTSQAMEDGVEKEPYARKELNKYTNLEFKEVGWLNHSTINILGVSPDGITDNDKFGCELKCPQRDEHTKTIIEGIIPKKHINQCLQNFVVNPKLEVFFFASFRPENKLVPLFVRSLTRNCMIDLGTKRKPDLETVQEWVVIAEEKAKQLEF